MTNNMGNLDRLARAAVGIVLIGFAIFGPADITWKWIGYIGIIPLVTSVIGFCPAYTLLGISTCEQRTES
ncbi:DUF2892 domain-containing protein [Tepidamorphus sp. 3E244]|uniref:YgaP family membrane protein n=1 Tax=Tepidamorphus sp. 3E244 TaxID=3385498 RepID=UPI0038FC7960